METPEQTVSPRSIVAQAREAGFPGLTAREAAILTVYYLAPEPITLSEAAKTCGIKFSSAGQYKRRGERKLGIPKQPPPPVPVGPGRPRSDASVRAAVELIEDLAEKYDISRAEAVARLRALA